jgi:hypothetical protein
MKGSDMKLNATMVYVVGTVGVTEMNLSMLVDTVNGGMKLSEVAIFTTKIEASDELRRRCLVRKITETLQRLDLDDLEPMAEQIAKEAIDRSVDRTLTKVLG